MSKDNYSYLNSVAPEEQIDVMRSWFLANYESPAESTPFESAEGGYIYIYGGPFDARDELVSVFGDYVTESVINELVEELESESISWTGIPREDDCDDDDDEIDNQSLEGF